MARASFVDGVAGTWVSPNSVHGHVPVICTEAGVGCRFALSSAALALIVTVPVLGTLPVYVQDSRPSAGCQVLPPSSDTSTPPTRPPTSDAVPVTVIAAPLRTEAPGAGEVIVVVGGVVSVDAVAPTSPLISVAGCAPMSARMLTVACCIRGS